MASTELRHILVRHEQGGGTRPRLHHRLRQGRRDHRHLRSGATNLVTAIADAYMDSIPIVAITGQVFSRLMGTDAFQEADIVGITMPITKHSILVKRPEDIPPGAIAAAFEIAATGRPRSRARGHHQGRAAGHRSVHVAPRSTTCRGGTAPP